MVRMTFDEFASAARADGCDEILQREWAPLAVLGRHAHPFAVKAIVARGDMWLTVGGVARHLEVDGSFELDADVVHEERYGAQGCTLWVGRRHAVKGGGAPG